MTPDPETRARQSADRKRSLLVLAAFVGTIVFNWLAAAGYLGGVTPAEISGKYPTVVTPATYAFSIWTLIYLGLAIFSVYQLTHTGKAVSRPIRSLFILSCALNCAWLFFWLQDQVVVSAVVLWALAAVLVLIDKKLKDQDALMLLRAVFGIYLGWVIVAAMVNSVIALAAAAVAFEFGHAAGATLILLAAAAALVLRVLLLDYFAPLAIAWGLTAIAVQQSGKTAIVAAAAIGVVACLIASFTFVLNLNSSKNE